MTEPGSWDVQITRRAVRDLRRLSGTADERIRNALRQLAIDPFHADTLKIRGAADERRLRVGDYRVRFGLDRRARTVVVLRVLHRREAYR